MNSQLLGTWAFSKPLQKHSGHLGQDRDMLEKWMNRDRKLASGLYGKFPFSECPVPQSHE